uniref:HDC13306 n=1 Tax=Drosophila melanogaster TaxID=7227 RepID=Q6IK61_DROME|nr:TPA_inf: HDC13306 [Drosophila melanogaster]
MPRFQLHPQLHWPIWPLKCLKSLAASPYFANTTPKTHCITCATHLGHIDLDPCQMPDNEPSTECLQPELLTGHMDAWTQCV